MKYWPWRRYEKYRHTHTQARRQPVLPFPFFSSFFSSFSSFSNTIFVFFLSFSFFLTRIYVPFFLYMSVLFSTVMMTALAAITLLTIHILFSIYCYVERRWICRRVKATTRVRLFFSSISVSICTYQIVHLMQWLTEIILLLWLLLLVWLDQLIKSICHTYTM